MDYSTQPLKAYSGLGHFRAPVYLPQGAVVTKLVVFGYDNLAGELYSVTLAKHVFTTNSEVVMAETVSADNPTNPQKNVDTTITDATITNNQATYFLDGVHHRAWAGGPRSEDRVLLLGSHR